AAAMRKNFIANFPSFQNPCPGCAAARSDAALIRGRYPSRSRFCSASLRATRCVLHCARDTSFTLDPINTARTLHVPHAGKCGHETFQRRGWGSLGRHGGTGRELGPAVAGGGVATLIGEPRHLVAATVDDERAAGVKPAAGRRAKRARQLALQDDA